MPAGEHLAGSEPFGYEPVQSSERERRFPGPVALHYDGRSRDWLYADGRAKSVHPVDQGMALSVLAKQGTIKSSPTTGSTLHEIEYLGSPDIQSDVEDRIKRSNPCARYLAEGLVELKRIEVDESGNRLRVAVTYVNLAVSATEQHGVTYYR